MISASAELIHKIKEEKQYAEDAVSADNVTLYKLDDCIWAGSSPYCSESVLGVSPIYGKTLFLYREIQSAESDEALYHEHLVQPIMNSTSGIAHKRVLIVGGGEGATAREVLKWSSEFVSDIDWVDIDGGLVDLCRRHLGWADDSVYNDPRLKYYAEDIRTFLRRCETKYDIIILDLPDPDCDELERTDTDEYGNYMLYGKQFLEIIRSHMTPSGALVTHCGPIRPGELEGIEWMASRAGFGKGYPYHTIIPSFQGQWGFWMSVPPRPLVNIQKMRIMDDGAQGAAFLWPSYWSLGKQ